MRLQAAKPRYGEKAIQGLLAACGILSVLTTTAIVVSLIGPTIGFFEVVPVGDFLFGTEWTPQFEPPSFGVLAIVAGTLNVTLWAMLFAIPIGLGSAVYLSEYASPRVRKTIKPVLEILAGIPTVAIGFFAASFILPEVIQPLWPGDFLGGADGKPFMALAAGLGIGLMVVPIIASISDDAMQAVPRGLHEGAYALGATRAKVAVRVIFPAALSGIVASVVL
ncbi:MAG TPA: ABC transporter permease subunit, partial [Gemmatimonadales bacterium]|nr:ABC transporter permease subunit [Gemmatimonadales bacterium]